MMMSQRAQGKEEGGLRSLVTHDEVVFSNGVVCLYFCIICEREVRV
jgi:hypothetical protein